MHQDAQPDCRTSTVLVERDAARYLGLSQSYLRKARRFGSGPPYLRCGRAVRYLVSDLSTWLHSKRVVGSRAAAVDHDRG